MKTYIKAAWLSTLFLSSALNQVYAQQATPTEPKTNFGGLYIAPGKPGQMVVGITPQGFLQYGYPDFSSITGTVQPAQIPWLASLNTTAINQAISDSQSAISLANSLNGKITSAINTANAANASLTSLTTIAQSALQKASDGASAIAAITTTVNAAATNANTAFTTANSVNTAVTALTSTYNTGIAAINSRVDTDETNLQNITNTANSANNAAIVSASNLAIVQANLATLQTSYSALNNQISALQAIVGTGTPTGPTTYNTPNDGMPFVQFLMDPNEPTTKQSLLLGSSFAPGIQIDSSTPPNVLALNDPINHLQAVHGFGELSLQTDSFYHLPYFHGGNDSFNNAYDGMTYVPNAGNLLVGPLGQPWGCLAVIRQTGAGATGLASIWGTNQVNWSGANGASDGATAVLQSNGAYDAVEPSGTPTAFNSLKVVSFFTDGQKFYINRGTTNTVKSSLSQVGGIGGLTRTEFLNNPQADIFYGPECWIGWPGNSVFSSVVHFWDTRYSITNDSANFTAGPTAAIAPLQVDTTLSFLNSPNFPSIDTLPTISGSVPGSGITLSSGFIPMFDMIFGRTTANANVTGTIQAHSLFYMNYLAGDLSNPFGSPQDTDKLGNTTFAAVARHYDPTDPNDLHKMRTDGLYLSAVCSQNHTHCYPGNVWGGMIRLPAAFSPGMVILVRYKAPPGPNAWTSIKLLSGEQTTPLPNGTNPYSGTGKYAVATTGHFYEIDLNDMYQRQDGSTPFGNEVIFTTPDVYGVTHTLAPYIVYAANTSTYITKSINQQYEEINRSLFNWSTTFENIILNWRNDGSKKLDILVGDNTSVKLIQTIYMEYNTDAHSSIFTPNGQLGMNLVIANQAIPGAALNGGVTPDYGSITENDSIPDGWSLKIQRIAAWKGTIVSPDSYRP